jgi:hypothetical protein
MHSLTRVTGKTAAQNDFSGNPEFCSDNDLTSWCTAAFAIPYLRKPNGKM